MAPVIQGFGLGARVEHYADLVRAADEGWANRPDWLEFISENFMVGGGPPLRHLEQLRARYPAVLHGVSLNLGSTTPLREDYLRDLCALVERVQPAWVSDHLCWTGSAHAQLHDLLPLPYSRAALDHLGPRIQQVQDRLRQPLVIENVSSYVQFAADEMMESEFIATLVRETGCRLLLDVNNVYVSHRNHGFDAQAFIQAIPPEAVVQIHLAGHEDQGDLVIDTHDHPIRAEVFALYTHTLQHLDRAVPTMIERDDHIPALAELLQELDAVRACARSVFA
ncbi:hypothetical protein HNQ51_002914 [Inhella inkyongensis]|uniref:Uncharacterized protein n=1 Tax=Inhella inkyongensis TaxID=392593 RepID=A0A840S300_9BURK|nr:DUF692 domain-containing protein [Inhella inkyongensis]MBB5205587.1 hypothetical protein [Inhella inkyongensis]